VSQFSFVWGAYLGGGGFADVYRATRAETGEQLAVKVLRAATNPAARHRFEREVRSMLALAHPGILPILGYNLTAERPFYVTPYMAGGTLTQYAGKLTPEQLRQIIRTLAGVLVHLHTSGGFHRDLKPDNILVDAAGNVCLSDFGLGNDPRVTANFTVNAAGTLGYMAPELRAGAANASSACDMYSLGATLFHMITGLSPYNAQQPLDPWTVRRDVPEDLRNYVVHLVKEDPARRPSASKVLEWINAGINPTSQTPTSPAMELVGSFAAIALGVAAVFGIAGLLSGGGKGAGGGTAA
jgi:serine/threonine protein kinase